MRLYRSVLSKYQNLSQPAIRYQIIIPLGIRINLVKDISFLTKNSVLRHGRIQIRHALDFSVCGYVDSHILFKLLILFHLNKENTLLFIYDIKCHHIFVEADSAREIGKLKFLMPDLLCSFFIMIQAIGQLNASPS